MRAGEASSAVHIRCPFFLRNGGAMGEIMCLDIGTRDAKPHVFVLCAAKQLSGMGLGFFAAYRREKNARLSVYDLGCSTRSL